MLSRVCAVAQYAVLEANTKVNGKSEFFYLNQITKIHMKINNK